LRWQWIRNPWFRWTHLLAIVLVALEALWGIDCPLTVWEGELRRLAGQEVANDTFVGRCLDALIFYEAPSWFLNTLHVGFALLVLGTLVLIPPRRRRPTAP
jgi:heme A synthase